MHRTQGIPAWKAIPFFRLLWPFIAGITWQWYFPFALIPVVTLALFSMAAFWLTGLVSLSIRFQWRVLQGIFIHLSLFAMGLFITYWAGPQRDGKWYGHHYRQNDALILTISEPLSEKAATFKAIGSVESVVHDGKVIPARGKLLLYFSKDPVSANLRYGDKILVHPKLQPITNSGNPGGFNYREYAAFHHWFHRAYLRNNDWIKLQERQITVFRQFIIDARQDILSVLRKNLSGNKDVSGIAEALLIGFTDDLDKDLVQAYSNTGVVHVIAISGMHLALIYALLTMIFKRLPLIRRSLWLQAIMVLVCLWTFSFITGASASVLRAAVMFSFMQLGRTFFRNASVFNSMAASAFVLLVYNPYYLWDAGFQLSYLAVAGILLFQKPLYRFVYISNKWLNKVWELASVTLAAQVLTFPVCIYYFHQFPLLFLFANLLIVPLSGVALYVEIALLAFSWIPYAGKALGILTAWLIGMMNHFIRWVNAIPFAVWEPIPAGILSTIMLYTVTLGGAYWLLNRNKPYLFICLFSLLGFAGVRSWDRFHFNSQSAVVIYNVPKHRAVDIRNGRRFCFIGDSGLIRDPDLFNFHMRPARIALQMDRQTDPLPGLVHRGCFYQFGSSRFALIDKSLGFSRAGKKIKLDFILFSNEPRITVEELQRTFDCPLLVFDASNRLWKIEQWRKEADALHLHCYSIPEQGAFIFPFNHRVP